MKAADVSDGGPIVSHFQLRVFGLAFRCAMEVFELSERWSAEERYSLTSQIRKASRSVCSNISEAWRKRRYVPHFVSKLSDADGESAETQTWLKFARECGYLAEEDCARLDSDYDIICGSLVKMMNSPQPWCGPASVRYEEALYQALPDDSP